MRHEYVDRAAIYQMINDEHPFGWTNNDLADALRMAKPADVAPVVHGVWLLEVYVDPQGGEWKRYKCNLCGRVEVMQEPYCSCGAKMKAGSSEL